MKSKSPPRLAKIARQGWGTRSGLLRGRLGCGRSRGFGRHFWGDWVDLHCRQDLREACEDFVAVDVLYQAFGRGVGRHIQRELVAGSILIDMELLRVALTRAFTADGFGSAKFHVADHQLRIRSRLR